MNLPCVSFRRGLVRRDAPYDLDPLALTLIDRVIGRPYQASHLNAGTSVADHGYSRLGVCTLGQQAICAGTAGPCDLGPAYWGRNVCPRLLYPQSVEYSRTGRGNGSRWVGWVLRTGGMRGCVAFRVAALRGLWGDCRGVGFHGLTPEARTCRRAARAGKPFLGRRQAREACLGFAPGWYVYSGYWD